VLGELEAENGTLYSSLYYLIPMRFDVMEIKFKSNHSTVMLDTTARLLA
jgi:hypothetical protein